MGELLNQEDRNFLLKLARQAIQHAVMGRPLPPLNIDEVPPTLLELGATFVTLTTRAGELRGCIGAIEPYLPLVEDVREHACASALQDYRFPPVSPEELKDIKIEISRLTPPKEVKYETPQDLIRQIRPGIDGVIFQDGVRRATFLPQVWEKIPNPEEFMSHLCMKMGAPPDFWRSKKLRVQVYQVEEFHEE